MHLTKLLNICFNSLSFLPRLVEVLLFPVILHLPTLWTIRLVMKVPDCPLPSLNQLEALKIFGGHMLLFARYFLIIPCKSCGMQCFLTH